MTEEEEKKMHHFEARVRQLIMKHKAVMEKNQQLQLHIDEQSQRIEQFQQRIQELEHQYATLKMAKMIEITSDETEVAQKRIAKLIREVDKCIAMLNV